MKYGMNLKFETIVQIFRKIKQLITVVILKSSNEYHRKSQKVATKWTFILLWSVWEGSNMSNFTS